ncbi:twin-arginine translocation signal domain-containing protein [Pedobacter sp. NJ-S-72]
MEEQYHNNSRRKFIQQTAIAGAGAMLVNPFALFSQSNKSKMMSKIKSKGYAGKDEQGKN